MSDIIVIPAETSTIAVDVLDPTISITVSMAAVGVGGGGGGGVSSVSATGQQGVTASVTSPTTTPSITIGLGAITPTSVTASGTVTGSNLSGTNTGDQVLTAGTLSGRSSTAGTGTAQTITLGTNLSMAGNVLNASGGGGNVPAGGSAGQFLQTDGTTPSWQYVQTVRLFARNSSGSTMAKGSVVYVSSADGIHPIISKGLATTDPTSSKTIGILESDVANNADGYVVVEGMIDGMATSGITEGAALYLSATTAGAFTTTKPVAPNHLVFVGYCIKASAGNGQIYVKPQNGYELDELHDVLITTPANNEVLTYESSTQLWKNKPTPQGTVTAVTGTAPVSSSGGTTPAISLSSAYGDTQNPYASKPAAQVLASPSGAAGAPSFRALVASDVPTLNQNTTGTAANVTGVVAVANGGTGASTLTGYVKGAGTTAMTASATIPGADIAGNISGNAANVTGTVAIANGGTGQTTAANAINALLPSQTGNTGKFLSTNGSVASWTTAGGSGTVTSIDVAGGTTGLTTSGGPVTTSGTITLAGTLGVANGGTGQTTYTNGQLLIGNTTGGTLTKATLTQGSGITITNGAGSITIAATNAGTVTSVGVSGGTTGLTTSGGPVTGAGTITLAGTLGVANGGTGATTLTGYVKGTGTTAMTASATIPGADVSGNISGNAANVTGTVAVGNGGTGATTLTGYVKGTGTTAMTASATIPGADVSGNISGNAANVTGTVAIANGGTGATTAANAINALLPSQSTNSGKFLTTDGTSASWATISGTGTVTSVAVSGGTTGLTTSGGPITTAGTITLAGTLALANGGTGATTAPTARTNLGLGNVENTALSTWTGSTTITTVGNITAGTWNGTAVGINRGGTNITSYTKGDMIYAFADNVLSKLGGNTSATRKILSQIGDGTQAFGPEWYTFDQVLPTQTGNSGKFLTTNGTNASWGTPAGSGTVTSVAVSGGTTGLTTSGGPITSSGTITLAGTLGVANGGTGATTLTGYVKGTGITAMTASATIPGADISGNISGNAANVTGTVAIANGGTGQTTAANAINALLPSQSTNSGKFLTTDGTSASWATISGSGTVTSVDVSGGTTGLTTSGGPVTGSGTITLAGTLGVANGGTGATTLTGYVKGTGTTAMTASATIPGADISGNISGNAANVTGTVAVANGGTGQTTYTDGQLLIGNTTGGTLTKATLTQGSGITITNGAGSITIAANNAGTVTSVDVSGGTTGLTTSGGPVTGSGTITLAGTLGVANGGTGAVSLTGYVKGTGTTAMTASATIPGADISGNISGNAANVTGTVAVGNGGTGAVSLTGYVKGTGTTAMTASATIPGADVSGNISGNAANVTGTVAIANGGTGQTTAANAINALLPSQSTNSGKFLTTDGTSASWATVSGTGTVTSVAVSGGTTGLTTSGGPITTSGTITLAGTLAVANGGTGQTTYTDGQLLIGNSTGNTLTKATLTAGSGIAVTNGGGSISVALASGYGDTLFPFVSSRTAGTVLAAPSGAAGTPSFRALVLTDITTALSTWTGSTSITTLGTIATGTWNGTAIGVSKGGTNITSYTLGDLLYATSPTALAKLGGNTSTALKVLTQTGTGAVSAAPVWSTFDQITPSQTGNAGDVLTTDGTTATWQLPAVNNATTPVIVYADTATSATSTSRSGNHGFIDTVSKSVRHAFNGRTDGAYGGGTIVNYITEVQTDASSIAEKITTIRSGVYFAFGDWVKFSGYFKFAANGNAKNINLILLMSGTTSNGFTIASSSASGSVIYAEYLIGRLNSTTWSVMGFVRSTTGALETVVDKQTISSTASFIDIQTSIQTTTAGAPAGNVIQRNVLLEWGPVGA
jgi:hypothetical protein